MELNYKYYYFKSALTDSQCDEIMAMGNEAIDDRIKTLGMAKATVVSDNQKSRNSDIGWLDRQDLYDFVGYYVQTANEAAGWNFDWEYSEMMQFTKYDVGQYFTWHPDSHANPYTAENASNPLHAGKIRKLSVTINLTDPAEYSGGDLQFLLGPQGDNIENKIYTCEEIRPRGSIVVFPSHVWHQVTPVTRGTRYSLVMWCLGNPFK